MNEHFSLKMQVERGVKLHQYGGFRERDKTQRQNWTGQIYVLYADKDLQMPQNIEFSWLNGLPNHLVGWWYTLINFIQTVSFLRN